MNIQENQSAADKIEKIEEKPNEEEDVPELVGQNFEEASKKVE